MTQIVEYRTKGDAREHLSKVVPLSLKRFKTRLSARLFPLAAA